MRQQFAFVLLNISIKTRPHGFTVLALQFCQQSISIMFVAIVSTFRIFFSSLSALMDFCRCASPPFQMLLDVALAAAGATVRKHRTHQNKILVPCFDSMAAKKFQYEHNFHHVFRFNISTGMEMLSLPGNEMRAMRNAIWTIFCSVL